MHETPKVVAAAPATIKQSLSLIRILMYTRPKKLTFRCSKISHETAGLLASLTTTEKSYYFNDFSKISVQ